MDVGVGTSSPGSSQCELVIAMSPEGSSTNSDLPLHGSVIAGTTCEMEEELAHLESDDGPSTYGHQTLSPPQTEPTPAPPQTEPTPAPTQTEPTPGPSKSCPSKKKNPCPPSLLSPFCHPSSSPTCTATNSPGP
ncbi:uncharacterized protein LOC128645671 [Bombina bombina]|uniref:uncharacterized protein LOC128645671 n=1 Tax=Bombina bombina TaxID=8345 RepID=UPI00235A79D2|nr:uncharacterized protein LOC128645671 [Bombina bombina]